MARRRLPVAESSVSNEASYFFEPSNQPAPLPFGLPPAEPVVSLHRAAKSARTATSASTVTDALFEQAVERRRNANEKWRAPPATRSPPWLTAAAGLGYQQSRLGDTLFECVRMDAASAVRSITSPFSMAFRLIIPGVILVLIVFLRIVFTISALFGGGGPAGESGGGAAVGPHGASSAETSKSYGSESNPEFDGSPFWVEFWVASAFFVLLASICSLCVMPDSGITADFKDEWDRTPLHVAAEHGALESASVMLTGDCSPSSIGTTSCVRWFWGRVVSPWRALGDGNSTTTTTTTTTTMESTADRSHGCHRRRPAAPSLASKMRRVDAEDYYLMTPLHVAAARGCAGMCRLLVEEGGSEARAALDAFKRRPYDLVPPFISPDREHFGPLRSNAVRGGGAAAAAASRSATTAGGVVDEARGHSDAEVGLELLPQRAVADEVASSPLLVGPRGSGDRRGEGPGRSRRRSEQGGSGTPQVLPYSPIMISSRQELRWYLGAPSGRLGAWVLATLFPDVRTAEAGGGGEGGRAQSSADEAEAIRTQFSGILETELARADRGGDDIERRREHCDGALKRHLRNCAIDGRVDGAGGQDTPLSLALIAFAACLYQSVATEEEEEEEEEEGDVDGNDAGDGSGAQASKDVSYVRSARIGVGLQGAWTMVDCLFEAASACMAADDAACSHGAPATMMMAREDRREALDMCATFGDWSTQSFLEAIGSPSSNEASKPPTAEELHYPPCPLPYDWSLDGAGRHPLALARRLGLLGGQLRVPEEAPRTMQGGQQRRRRRRSIIGAQLASLGPAVCQRLCFGLGEKNEAAPVTANQAAHRQQPPPSPAPSHHQGVSALAKELRRLRESSNKELSAPSRPAIQIKSPVLFSGVSTCVPCQ